MSSKGGRNKRAKNVRNLDSEKAPSLAQTIIDKQNIIPGGRQLERTPPSRNEKVAIYKPNKPGSPTSERVVKEEPCAQEIAQDISCNGSDEVLQHPKVKDERKSIRRSSLTVASATPGNADSEVFIQGMQGYQWTDTDLEFVNQAKRKKQVQQMQQELSDVQKSLKSMKQAQDMALAAHDKIQAELSKVLSSERIQQISMELLLRSQSSSQLEGLDLKALLAKLKVADVLCTTSEEKTEVSKLKIEVENAQAMREKEEQHTKDIENCEKNVNRIKMTVHELTAEIAALESQLSDKKEAPQSPKRRQKVNKGPKPSAPPKPSKPPAAPKPSKPPAAPSAPKTSSPLAAPSAPKPSKPPATQKKDSKKTAKASKPTTVPKAPEGDVRGLRRSKRIAAKKEN